MAGQAMIDHGRLLDVLGIEARLLASIAADAPMEAPVPMCPGFTVRETVRHIGSVYRVARLWIVHGRRPEHWRRNPLPEQSVLDYFEQGYDELVAELAAHGPGERAATWWPEDPTYGFWRRRMAHETTVHRTDVESAAGAEPGEIPEDVAVDGIDEVLSLWFGQRLRLLGLSGGESGTVAVSAGGHTWVARAGPDGTEAWRVSARAAEDVDAMVTADPMTLYLWLWGRLPLHRVKVNGSQSAAAQFWALLRLATR
jgi:uncharacterized protein (TIGR03083 family)